MRFVAGVLISALVLIGQGQTTIPPRIVMDWIPLNPGNRWIYEHETRDQTFGPQLDIHHWTTELTVLASWAVPEGNIVGVRSRLIAGALPPGIRKDWADRDLPYLIRGNCLYSDEVTWDSQTHMLSPEFQKELSAGHMSPDFCFPLTVGQTWGAPNYMNLRPANAAADWKVENIVPADKFSPDKGGTFHITSVSSYLGSGMTGDIWFEKGVGIVRKELIHHGTIGEDRERLVRFEAAKANLTGR